jgi:hypothetical protein
MDDIKIDNDDTGVTPVDDASAIGTTAQHGAPEETDIHRSATASQADLPDGNSESHPLETAAGAPGGDSHAADTQSEPIMGAFGDDAVSLFQSFGLDNSIATTKEDSGSDIGRTTDVQAAVDSGKTAGPSGADATAGKGGDDIPVVAGNDADVFSGVDSQNIDFGIDDRSSFAGDDGDVALANDKTGSEVRIAFTSAPQDAVSDDVSHEDASYSIDTSARGDDIHLGQNATG